MNPLFSSEIAEAFASDWIAAWNARDLDRILAHYASNIEFSSPLIKRVMSYDRGVVRGIAVLRVYFGRALNAYPDLRFELRRIYAGAETLAVEYRSVGDWLSCEMMQFNDAGLVSRAWAHYAAPHATITERADPS